MNPGEFCGLVLAPKGTFKAIIEKVNPTVINVVNTQAIRDQFAFQDAEVATSTPGDYGKAVQEEIAELGKAIKAAGMKAE